MTRIKLVNYDDVILARAGHLPASAVRSVEIDALADTGAISLAIPRDVADALGVGVIRRSPVQVADGRSIEVDHVGPIQVEVVGRDMITDVMVLPAGTIPLLGAVQMEMLDLIVSPSTGEVIPRDPRGPVLPMLRAS